MKKLNKNNKGFSLVELIVVVLIMAIIAVALAPQVMKWVDNSKIATDSSSYDGLVSTCQLALTDSAAYTEVKSQAYVIQTDDEGTKLYKATISGTSVTVGNEADSSAKMHIALGKVDAGWASVKAKVVTETYQILINTDGTIERLDPPAGDSVS